MTAAEQLAAYAAGFSDARDRLHRLADPLSDEAFNWKPDARSWSIGECIVHLNKVGGAYVPLLREGVQASPLGAGPFRYGWLSRKFIDAVRPGSRSVPTVGGMKPPETDSARSAIDRDRAFADLNATTAGFIDVVSQAEGRDLGAVKVPSPFLSVLRLPVGAFVEAMSLHALRHTGQAERVAQTHGFPG